MSHRLPQLKGGWGFSLLLGSHVLRTLWEGCLLWVRWLSGDLLTVS